MPWWDAIDWKTIGGAATAFSGFGSFLIGRRNKSDQAVSERIKRHVEVLKALPAESGSKDVLAKAVDNEVAEFARDLDLRTHRKLQPYQVAALALVAILGAAITIGLFLLAGHFDILFFSILFYFLAGIAALLTGTLSGLGYQLLWKDSREAGETPATT